MKVYLVVEDYTYDFIEELQTKAFNTLEKAKEYFTKQVEETKKNYIDEINSNEIVVEEDEKNFSIYYEGYYGEEHTDINIIEKEIQ